MAAFAAEMLTQEQAVEIRVLARQGLHIREIARRMNCSRNTVRRYLREPEAATYSARAARPTKLGPFEPYLLERIAAARPDWIPATVLLRELRARGYTGGYSQLKAFVARHRPQPPEDPIVRFETEPGHQMQADFTIIRRGRAPLLAFVATLGYSRASFVRFSTREDSPAWCSGLEHAFEYFGGVPRTVLFDNAKTVIIERDVFGPGLHRWHPNLLRLADRYGFSPRVCRPYRTRTKGKVERFNGYDAAQRSGLQRRLDRKVPRARGRALLALGLQQGRMRRAAAPHVAGVGRHGRCLDRRANPCAEAAAGEHRGSHAQCGVVKRGSG